MDDLARRFDHWLGDEIHGEPVWLKAAKLVISQAYSWGVVLGACMLLWLVFH